MILPGRLPRHAYVHTRETIDDLPPPELGETGTQFIFASSAGTLAVQSIPQTDISQADRIDYEIDSQAAHVIGEFRGIRPDEQEPYVERLGELEQQRTTLKQQLAPTRYGRLFVDTMDSQGQVTDSMVIVHTPAWSGLGSQTTVQSREGKTTEDTLRALTTLEPQQLIGREPSAYDIAMRDNARIRTIFRVVAGSQMEWSDEQQRLHSPVPRFGVQCADGALVTVSETPQEDTITRNVNALVSTDDGVYQFAVVCQELRSPAPYEAPLRESLLMVHDFASPDDEPSTMPGTAAEHLLQRTELLAREPSLWGMTTTETTLTDLAADVNLTWGQSRHALDMPIPRNT
jgi:hypothetical protein